MKILINGLQLSNKNSGVQYYTQNLYNELIKVETDKTKYYLHRSLITANKFYNFLLPFLSLFSPLFIRIKRILYENILMPSFIRKNFDLYHSPNYILPYFITSPSVITIHDLIVFDYPELCQSESVLYFRLFLPKSVQKAHKIIAVSEVVKNDLLRHFNIPFNKVSVVHLGISPIFKRTINDTILKKYKIYKKYILFVGNIEPKKNLVRLIKAYNNLNNSKKIHHKLVIAGKKGWKYNPVFNVVKYLRLKDKVIFTDYVQENDLPVLYSMAELFVFPSIYEGFGIPPLEAMACEIPVLVSNRGALPETTGGNCLMVDPYDVESIANGIYRLLSDEKLRKENVKRGKDWVRNFTWEKAAQRSIEVYKEVEKQIKEKDKIKN